jgi:hypothetical protein
VHVGAPPPRMGESSPRETSFGWVGRASAEEPIRPRARAWRMVREKRGAGKGGEPGSCRGSIRRSYTPRTPTHSQPLRLKGRGCSASVVTPHQPQCCRQLKCGRGTHVQRPTYRQLDTSSCDRVRTNPTERWLSKVVDTVEIGQSVNAPTRNWACSKKRFVSEILFFPWEGHPADGVTAGRCR